MKRKSSMKKIHGTQKTQVMRGTEKMPDMKGKLNIWQSTVVLAGMICLFSLAGCQNVDSADTSINDIAVESHADLQTISAEIESIGNDTNNIKPQEHTVEGFVLADARDVPVRVTLGVENVQRGQEALAILQEQDATITPPDEGEEYIIVTFHVSYDDGEIEELDMSESRASMETARLFFALSNGQSNADDVTASLSNSIYSISLTKGQSAQGAVAFVQEKGNTEPLVFVGFGQTVSFDIN